MAQETVKRIHQCMVTASSMKLLYVTPEKVAKSKRFMAQVMGKLELQFFTCLSLEPDLWVEWFQL